MCVVVVSFSVAWTSEALLDQWFMQWRAMCVACCSQATEGNNWVCLARLKVAPGAGVGLPSCTQTLTLVIYFQNHGLDQGTDVQGRPTRDSSSWSALVWTG